MRRREFISLIGGAVAAWPFAARGQQLAMPVVGFINAASPQPYARMLSAFLKGLEEAGYVDGRNVAIEYRWAEGRYDRLPALAADLVRREVTVIAATSTPAALAAKAATATIPIVFETGGDPVRVGLVASFSRPGGNVTGVTQTNQLVTPKRLQLLHELIPKAAVIALLVNPTDETFSEALRKQVQAAADALGLEIHILNVSSDQDIDDAFAKLSQLRVGGLVVTGGPLFTSRADRLAALALRYAMPTIFQYREFAAAGGLVSYSGSLTESYRTAGNYTGRVLKGEKPADLPVQQVTKVEMIVNLKTAKALGINVPNTLIGRADEVIE